MVKYKDMWLFSSHYGVFYVFEFPVAHTSPSLTEVMIAN